VTNAPLLDVRKLAVAFPLRSGPLGRARHWIRAVDDVSLRIAPGETLGLVGESGSGKSTLGRAILRLLEPSAGEVRLGDTELTALGGAELRRVRRRLQMIFQDPHASFDPRATVADSLGEPLTTHLGLRAAERDARAAELLFQVGLGPEFLTRHPAQCSGGQIQRIAIARALASGPELIVCDEPLSSLDVSTQAQVINLLEQLRTERRLSYLFISHDLSVVRHVSDRIAVMYLGRIVEIGDAEQICTRPRHPYTEALLSAVPIPDPRRQRQQTRIVLRGDLPSPANPPPGCRFHTRCPYVMDLCRRVDPLPFAPDAAARVACHLHESGPALGGDSVRNLPLQQAESAPGDRRADRIGLDEQTEDGRWK
jgi:oligopeptide/dipeptide ABC transporter ATP-binding protein